MPVLGLRELRLQAADGRRLSHQRLFHHSVGTGQIFTATHYDLRGSGVAVNFLSDGFSPSTFRILSGCSARGGMGWTLLPGPLQ